MIRRLGSTVPYVVERIVQQGVEANKKRVFIPTGALLSIFHRSASNPSATRVPVQAIDC